VRQDCGLFSLHIGMEGLRFITTVYGLFSHPEKAVSEIYVTVKWLKEVET